jgi:YVTN family beta-propeller protein
MDKRSAKFGCGRIVRVVGGMILAFAGLVEAATITFSPTPVGGTVTTNTGGIVCGTGGSVCTSTEISPGTLVMATATPDPGYSFVQWSIPSNPSIIQNPLTAPMPAASFTAQATFQLVSITASSLTPGVKALVLGDGANLTVTLSAAPLVDTVVTIDSQPAGIVSAPGTVTVLAGQTTALVPVMAILQGTATVTATLGASNAASVVQVLSAPVVPDAPMMDFADLGTSNDVTVHFLPPVTDGGSPITSYTVTSSPGGITASGPGSPIHLTGLANFTSYTFTVIATNAVGDSAPSGASNIVTPGGVPPDAPFGCTAAVSGDLTISVSCLAPNDGGSHITAYTATSSPGGLTGTSADVTAIPVSGLTRGVAYSFTVTATNAAGTGPASLATCDGIPGGVACVVAEAVPGAPTGVTAVAGLGTATVSWTAPADDGGAPIIKYSVYSSVLGKVADSASSGAVVSAPAGVPATYTVTATNEAGESAHSAPSSIVTATASLPTAPRRVHAMAGDGRVTVSFVVPVSNGGAPITSYIVTSSPDGISASGAASPINVTGLANGSAYTFTVAAVNLAGTGPSSTVSNVVLPASIGPRTSPRAYVPSAGDNLVAVIDTATERVITTIAVGNFPTGVAVNTGGSRVYVSNAGDNTLSVINAIDNTVVATIPVGQSPGGVAVNPAGTRVYVANSMDNSVSVIDAATNAVIATVPGVQYPGGIAVHPSGSPVYVAGGLGSLYRIDGNTNLMAGSTALTLSVLDVALAPGGGSVYLSGGGSFQMATVTGNTIGLVSALPGSTCGIAVSPTNGREYLTVPTSNSVFVVDNGAVVPGNTAVGANPCGLAFTPSGDRLYVANQDDGTVSVINPANNTLVTTIPVGDQPMAFGAFVGPEPISVPGAPGNAIATAGNAQATVSFTAPGFDGGGPITSYTVTSSPGGISASGSGSPIIVPGLANGTTYTFTVAATNSAGVGPASLASNAVTPHTVPDAPSSVSALAGDGEATITFATPSNGGAAITVYAVTCTPGPVQATGSSSPIVVLGLVNATTYTCSVRATNAAGTGPASSGVSVTPLATSATTLASSAASITVGDVVTLTATVSGAAGMPTGSVVFRDGNTPIATQPLDGTGHAILATSTLAIGSHVITADYAGTSPYAASSSSPVTVAVHTANPPRLGAISTRMQVLTGDNVLIGGFIVSGSTPKTVVVRARGPSLASSGITNFLANPLLQLVFGDGTVITNDDWQGAANAADILSSGFAPSDAHEAAIMVTLQPGPYTAIVSGSGGGTGVGLVEVFEVDHPEVPLAGISTRGKVLTGNDVMIGGIIIQGDAPQTVVVRARGPSLVAQGVANALSNPLLQVVASDGTVLTNDDWQSAGNAAQIQSSGFAPADPRESAILVTLQPGAYTAIVSGVGGATGVGIVEVYTVGP